MHEPRDAPEPPEAPEDSFVQRTMMAWTPVCSGNGIISRALEAHENASTATHKTLRPHLQGLDFQFNEWPLLSQAFDTNNNHNPNFAILLRPAQKQNNVGTQIPASPTWLARPPKSSQCQAVADAESDS